MQEAPYAVNPSPPLIHCHTGPPDTLIEREEREMRRAVTETLPSLPS